MQVVVSIIAVGMAVALVLILTGLRHGMGVQATRYVDNASPVIVGQKGTTNFMSQTSVLPKETIGSVASVRGVKQVDSISVEFAMLHLHGRRVVGLLVGSDPGHGGGPWSLAAGRPPSNDGDVVVDEVMAGSHHIVVGSVLSYRRRKLTVVGLSSQTSGFMLPTMFTTRATINDLNGRQDTATFLLVTPAEGALPAETARRINGKVSGVSALRNTELARNDRRLLVGAFNGVLTAMIVIAAAVAVLVIALSIMSAIHARARSFATLKALGMPTSRMHKIALFQAFAIAVGGAITGVALSEIVAVVVQSQLPRYLIIVTATAIAWMVVAAFGMAIVGALVPIRSIVRIDPAEAYRR